MLDSLVGVAESIRVYHKPAAHSQPDVHVLDIEWVDPSHQVHNRRVVCHIEHLRCPSRGTYLVGETIPGVGQLLVDCPMVKDPSEEPQFSARLLRGVQDFVEIPILHQIEDPDDCD